MRFNEFMYIVLLLDIGIPTDGHRDIPRVDEIIKKCKESANCNGGTLIPDSELEVCWRCLDGTLSCYCQLSSGLLAEQGRAEDNHKADICSEAVFYEEGRCVQNCTTGFQLYKGRCVRTCPRYTDERNGRCLSSNLENKVNFDNQPKVKVTSQHHILRFRRESLDQNYTECKFRYKGECFVKCPKDTFIFNTTQCVDTCPAITAYSYEGKCFCSCPWYTIAVETKKICSQRQFNITMSLLLVFIVQLVLWCACFKSLFKRSLSKQDREHLMLYFQKSSCPGTD